MSQMLVIRGAALVSTYNKEIENRDETMMDKEISLVIDDSTWTHSTVPPSLSGKSGKYSFNLFFVLQHISFATRHPEYTGIKLNDFWALLRYANCFDAGREFRLSSNWEEVDPHQKTILSDDFGMGFASHFLTIEMELIAFTNTNYFLKHLPSLSILHKSKRGPSKTPDFILVDKYFNIHLLECKGTQDSLKSLDAQLNKGIPQKRNIRDPLGMVNERLVTGIFIPQYRSRSKATFKIIDPEFNLDFTEVTKQEIVIKGMQGQLAKELQLFEMFELGNKVAQSENLAEIKLDEVIKSIAEQKNISFRQIEQIENQVVEWNVKFDLGVINEYRTGKDDSLLEFLGRILKSNKKFSPISSYQEGERSITKGFFGVEISAEVQVDKPSTYAEKN